VAAEAVDFALFTLDVFDKIVLKNSGYVDLIVSTDSPIRPTTWAWWMKRNRLNF